APARPGWEPQNRGYRRRRGERSAAFETDRTTPARNDARPAGAGRAVPSGGSNDYSGLPIWMSRSPISVEAPKSSTTTTLIEWRPFEKRVVSSRNDQLAIALSG